VDPYFAAAFLHVVRRPPGTDSVMALFVHRAQKETRQSARALFHDGSLREIDRCCRRAPSTAGAGWMRFMNSIDALEQKCARLLAPALLSSGDK
jgi:hypothetical protein